MWSGKNETRLPRLCPVPVPLCHSPVIPELAKRRNNQPFLSLGQKPVFSCEMWLGTHSPSEHRALAAGLGCSGPLPAGPGCGLASDRLCHPCLAVPTASGSQMAGRWAPHHGEEPGMRLHQTSCKSLARTLNPPSGSDLCSQGGQNGSPGLVMPSALVVLGGTALWSEREGRGLGSWTVSEPWEQHGLVHGLWEKSPGTGTERWLRGQAGGGVGPVERSGTAPVGQEGRGRRVPGSLARAFLR